MKLVVDAVRAAAVLTGLGIACAALSAGLWAQDPPSDRISGRLVDLAGAAIAEGTPLQACVEWFGQPPSGIGPAWESITVGPGGRFELKAPPWRSFGPDGKSARWLHVKRTGADGRRERVFAPARADLGTLTLKPEERLASGTLVDEQGSPVPAWSGKIDLLALGEAVGPRAWDLLGPRWVHADGSYELWGWRAEGAYALRAFYLCHGPASADVPLVFGKHDLALTLPATGFLQGKLLAPAVFPERAAFAVMRDLDRGGAALRHFLIPRNATNIRLRTGRYQVTWELNGATVMDSGTVVIAHNRTQEVTVDLSAARVFCVEVVDPSGKPIPAARVRVVGSPDEPLCRQPVRIGEHNKHVIVVATTKERVDLEVSEFGYAPLPVDGVGADRVVVLKPQRR